ncbi:MAG: hypothetical protein EXX96DRAFT_543009 [Benjaminiella poitrasii]|nr:MAG: hypothetical protein EXX96DRAFT_543009 [Benjaminiella poitrasii]
MIVTNQHPQVYACVSASDGPRRYLEVYVESAADQANLQDHGLLFSKSKLRVLLFLSSRFDALLDVGVLTNPRTKHFMGLGYDVSDISHCSVAVKGGLSPDHIRLLISSIGAKKAIISSLHGIIFPHDVDTVTRRAIPSLSKLSVDNEETNPTFVPEDQAMAEDTSDDESDRMSEVSEHSTTMSGAGNTTPQSPIASSVNESQGSPLSPVLPPGTFNPSSLKGGLQRPSNTND